MKLKHDMCLHSTHSQDDADHGFLSLGQLLELPDNDERENRECPIAKAHDSRVGIDRTSDSCSIKAETFGSSKPCPEVRHWRALEDEQQEEGRAVQLGHDEHH